MIMRTEDKKRFDLYRAGLTAMGLRLNFEPHGDIKSWIVTGNDDRPIYRIFYEIDKPFNERFSLQPVRSRHEC